MALGLALENVSTNQIQVLADQEGDIKREKPAACLQSIKAKVTDACSAPSGMAKRSGSWAVGASCSVHMCVPGLASICSPFVKIISSFPGCGVL